MLSLLQDGCLLTQRVGFFQQSAQRVVLHRLMPQGSLYRAHFLLKCPTPEQAVSSMQPQGPVIQTDVPRTAYYSHASACSQGVKGTEVKYKWKIQIQHWRWGDQRWSRYERGMRGWEGENITSMEAGLTYKGETGACVLGLRKSRRQRAVWMEIEQTMTVSSTLAVGSDEKAGVGAAVELYDNGSKNSRQTTYRPTKAKTRGMLHKATVCWNVKNRDNEVKEANALLSIYRIMITSILSCSKQKRAFLHQPINFWTSRIISCQNRQHPLSAAEEATFSTK